jgi:hypothetical protein
MSLTINYYFNYPKSLPELAEEVNAHLGCSLAPYEGDAQDLFDYFLGMEFSLSSAQGLENDGELNFESFQYEISFRTPLWNAGIRPIQLAAMACIIYALHHYKGITGMLVYDRQALLARYEEHDIPEYGKSLYDMVSETPFVRLAEHLDILKKRFSEEDQVIFC